MPYVYVLKSSKNSRYYIGSCEDIEKRLCQHNAGRVKSTKPFIPWLVIYKEKMDVKLARRRELQIKSWKSRSSIEKLIKHF